MFENFVQDFLFIVNKLEWFFSEFFFSLLGKILVKRFVYVKLYRIQNIFLLFLWDMNLIVNIVCVSV